MTRRKRLIHIKREARAIHINQVEQSHSVTILCPNSLSPNIAEVVGFVLPPPSQ